MAVQTFGVTTDQIAAALGLQTMFSASTRPPAATVTTILNGVAAEIGGILRGHGFDPDTIYSTYESDNAYCADMLLQGACWRIGPLLFSALRPEMIQSCRDNFERLRRLLLEDPAVLGESYSLSGNSRAIATHSPTDPQGGSQVVFTHEYYGNLGKDHF